MGRIVSKDQLWISTNEEILKLMKGKQVKVHMDNGEIKDVKVVNLTAATNSPNLYTGFITSCNQKIGLKKIEYVEIED